MEIITQEVINSIGVLITTAKKDPKAELECKVLCDRIQTKDVADRLMKTIEGLSVGTVTETHTMTFSYPDRIRVNVMDTANIFKLISTNSFRGVTLRVERKESYYNDSRRDVLDIPEALTKFTLKSETELRNDWDGNPNDQKSHVRLIHRRSFMSSTELFCIDFSMVKTRPANTRMSLKTLLKQQPKYELEVECFKMAPDIPVETVAEELKKAIMLLLQSYYQTPFILPVSDLHRYEEEFKMSNNVFFNPVTMMRRHICQDIPHNISKGYTVTVKADGERAGLYVTRDRKLLKVTKRSVTWTGITALNDAHIGDFMDGEYILENNLFCIFDAYRFRNRDVRSLPLMKTDEDLNTNTRLGVAKAFIESLKTDFVTAPSLIPFRVETKLFLSGDGPSMEEAIRTALNTDYEYETDGLIFTPKDTGVAPAEDRKGLVWTRVYKWKPADQNSIDFLVVLDDKEGYDPVMNVPAKMGQLYVGRTPQEDNTVYPRETMTGEYVPPSIHESIKHLIEANTRIPSIFQPSLPRDPDAYKISVPMNDKGIAVDINNNKVESNTIIECVYDTETKQWKVLRTRHDKTHEYRVLHRAQYGNDISTADENWTSIHVPITEQMLTSFSTNPIEEGFLLEDDYYRDDLKRSSRVFEDVYEFHNHIKAELYRKNVEKGNTLLELAMGRGGDMQKWKKTEPSKVVGIDISLANITSPKQGAAIRYLTMKYKNTHSFIPPALFLEGDITHFPLFEQEDKYMPILLGTETPGTEYLEQFKGLQEFDVTSCQFAIHYACETEETFRNFVKNVHQYCKGTFFGTCLDGQAVYSMMLGKKTQLFGTEKKVAGEYTKLYEDRESWTEEFGLGIKVFLESFSKPETEYLVPFEKVIEIFKEYNFVLEETHMFSDLYQQQTNIRLTEEQQKYSFLNRTFSFKRVAKIEEPKVEPEPEPTPAEVKVEEEEKTKKKLKKEKKEPELEPVLFNVGDETGGDFAWLSNDFKRSIDIDGTTYLSVTHFVASMQALEAKNDDLNGKIMAAKTAKAAKAYVKKLKFNEEEWDKKKDGIVEKGVRAKFTQHPELRAKLLETDNKPIGFADARDTYWGIGTSMETDKAKSPSKWRGQNKLGKIIETLRSILKEEAVGQ
jgi:hypothetical protein